MDKAAAWLGGIDALACIAGGYQASGPFEQAPATEWAAMMQQNLDTVRLVCQYALPHLLRSRGAVVTVGARAASEGGSGAAAYSVSKAAVMALTRVLALESRTRGVRFNCVVPGTIDTAANRRAMGEAQASRWTSPDEIARTIVALLSPETSAVTGAFVPVDRPPGGPSGA
jgi:NAD(P)-dependent dehydrogenase (short-subunit alcohol dehydrogenase family)